jgi:3-hydroxyacyl-[acyl-carrier-protein] dehydratase
MDINEVLKYLPHRQPFLLVDRVVEFETGKSLVALKNVSYNEPFFAGHFPNRPVMPGVLIVEALAQAAAILAYKSTDTLPSDGVLFLFAGIDKVRFRRVVEPGDQLRLEVNMLWNKREIFKIASNAYVDGEIACTAEILSARTYQRG